MGPMSSSGRIIGQGNLVEAKAMLKKAGNTIAAIQRMVFHFSRFFFSEFFIRYGTLQMGFEALIWLRRSSHRITAAATEATKKRTKIGARVSALTRIGESACAKRLDTTIGCVKRRATLSLPH
jgi:hypothetical protein